VINNLFCYTRGKKRFCWKI